MGKGASSEKVVREIHRRTRREKYVPVDDHEALLEELRLATRYDEPLAP